MKKSADGALGRPDMCWMPMDTVGEPASPQSVLFSPFSEVKYLPCDLRPLKIYSLGP